MRPTLFLLIVTLCLPAGLFANPLPNQRAEMIYADDGTSQMRGWSRAPRGAVEDRHVPDNPAFAGAVRWNAQVNTSDPADAARNAAADEGLTDITVTEIREVPKPFVELIDFNPESRMFAVTLTGDLEGAPARAIFGTWYTNIDLEPDKPMATGTHGFMAPTPVFEALGGAAIVGVGFLEQVTTEDADMAALGSLPDPDAAELLRTMIMSFLQRMGQIDQMMNDALSGMVGATMQSTITSMQSYNNALSACGGLGCSMSLGAGGVWSLD